MNRRRAHQRHKRGLLHHQRCSKFLSHQLQVLLVKREAQATSKALNISCHRRLISLTRTRDLLDHQHQRTSTQFRWWSPLKLLKARQPPRRRSNLSLRKRSNLSLLDPSQSNHHCQKWMSTGVFPRESRELEVANLFKFFRTLKS